jgi:hypothetical protein
MNDKKLDRILEEIGEIKLDLREHMLRTEQNEEMIEKLNTMVSPLYRSYVGITWVVCAAIGIATVASTVLKFLP